MSTGPRAADGVPNGVQSLLRGNPDAAVRLPAPGETYRLRDLPAEVARVFRRFRAHDVIRRADDADGDRTYRTDPAAYRHARHLETDRATFPCGHGGVKNLRGDGYACGEPTCDARYGRSAARRVLAHESR